MLPIYFGAEPRRLFGIFTARAATATPRLAVVLCNAFGREAIRAHRLYRVLSERLSRAGCDVLRFDYFGTGDSAGDDQDADLEGFRADILQAHAELLRHCGPRRMVWMGMRAGAAAVQLAAQQAPSELARIVLWDPIGDGRDYLDLLRTRHLQWLTEGEDPIGEVPPMFRMDPDFYIDEAIGFPLTRRLCDQLRGFRFAERLESGSFETAAIVDPQTAEGREVAAQCQARAGRVWLGELSHGTDWTSEKDSTGLVPAPVMNALIERICA
jgi:pimeloyl-ACP methyl ester carboxylesterase